MMMEDDGGVAISNVHRYWRLIQTANAYASTYGLFYNDLEEIELFSSANATGSDLTTGKTAVASSIFSATYSANKAIDDSTTTRWATVLSPSIYAWIYIDLGTPAEVHSLTIHPTGLFYAQQYGLQYSDDATSWTTQATINPISSAGILQTFTNL